VTTRMRYYATLGSAVYAVGMCVVLLTLEFGSPIASVLTVCYLSTMVVLMFVWLRKEEELISRHCADPDCFMCERRKSSQGGSP
jgi:hypothetical protein